jgi:hypothetical protein
VRQDCRSLRATIAALGGFLILAAGAMSIDVDEYRKEPLENQAVSSRPE